MAGIAHLHAADKGSLGLFFQRRGPAVQKLAADPKALVGIKVKIRAVGGIGGGGRVARAEQVGIVALRGGMRLVRIGETGRGGMA